MSYRSGTSLPVGMSLAVILLLISCRYYGCPRPQRAETLLIAEGYTDITIYSYGGYGWSCSEKDGSATGFTARHGGADLLEGVVCCGLVFKACTIRVIDTVKSTVSTKKPERLEKSLSPESRRPLPDLGGVPAP